MKYENEFLERSYDDYLFLNYNKQPYHENQFQIKLNYIVS
jgi:hypothetical protein